MEKLIKLLNKLFETEEGLIEEDGKRYFKNSDLTNEIIGLCDIHLITDNGGCNWASIKLVEDAGYRIYPGEKDSFGWLTGCVSKKGDPLNRVLVYG